ncbi:MAG: hypothetical protein ACRDIB_16095 [Ardenticatenaceae bacterium]
MAATTITLLLFGLVAAIATAQERVVATLRANVTQVKQWGGVVLLFVGAWLIALAIWAEFFVQFFPV